MQSEIYEKIINPGVVVLNLGKTHPISNEKSSLERFSHFLPGAVAVGAVSGKYIRTCWFLVCWASSRPPRLYDISGQT